MHFCHVEMMAILSAIPMIGVGIVWFRKLFRGSKSETPVVGDEMHRLEDCLKLEEDYRAIRRDWLTVGNDIRKSMGLPRKYD